MIRGDRVRDKLKAIGKSQAALARAIGVSSQAINKIVKGETTHSAHLYQIARFLRTTPEFVSGETDDDSASDLPDRHLTAEEEGFVEKLRMLSPEDREMILQLTGKLSGRLD